MIATASRLHVPTAARTPGPPLDRTTRVGREGLVLTLGDEPLFAGSGLIVEVARVQALGERALEQMLAGLSTRRYGLGLEPVGEQVAAEATATSKSAISRRFVKATEAALSDLMTRDLSGMDLVAFVVDGVRFGEHVCVVALGSRSRASRCRWRSRKDQPRTRPWPRP